MGKAIQAMKAIKAGQGSTVKGKAVIKKKVVAMMKIKPRRVRKSDLRSALVSALKTKSGRADIAFKSAGKAASTTQCAIPIEDRAGYPVKFPEGAVDPKDWKTHHGVKIEVDFSRPYWLPDDWGQGVKITEKNGRSTGTGGGTLTTYVGPDMKAFFHRHMVEQYIGRKLTKEDGWNGQVRQAKLQARQAMAVQREGRETANSGVIGQQDASLFKLLSQAEQKHMPQKEDFHFCVISARRATNLKGVHDIYTVQALLEDAGVTPTWYVGENCVDDYKALGLQVVKGGKLTPSRNLALKDANSKGKICVQVSDDISNWEYRDGKRATERTDDAVNAAHAKAKRYIISPVAAAQFVVAKMRGAEHPQPKLGGAYMLGSCARTFAGDEFCRQHFILGDFLVVDKGSTVLFDETIGLKEDYDFTCAHIEKYGSVMRCNRLTITVKHYDNAGGAVSNRNTNEEQRNINILNSKWPGCFRKHPRRKNEVILKWKGAREVDFEDEDDDEEVGDKEPKTPSSRKLKTTSPAKHGRTTPTKVTPVSKMSKSKVLRNTPMKAQPNTLSVKATEKVAEKFKEKMAAGKWQKASETKTPKGWPAGSFRDPSSNCSWLPKGFESGVTVTSGGQMRRIYVGPNFQKFFHKADVEKAVGRELKVKKTIKKRAPAVDNEFGSTKVIALGSGAPACDYIKKRCQKLVGKTVKDALDGLKYKHSNGADKKYGVSDLRYDILRKFIVLN